MLQGKKKKTSENLTLVSHRMYVLTLPKIGISVKVLPDALLSITFQMHLFNLGT